MIDHTITHATFSLERIYPVRPNRVFDAWADPAIKVRWFSSNAQDYELDFSPGGIERLSATHDGKLITWESLYREIVTDERIVYTSVLSEQDTVATVSLTTVEIVPKDEGICVDTGRGRRLPRRDGSNRHGGNRARATGSPLWAQI